MAESMVGLKRTHRCTEVSNANVGEKVTVMGWVAKRRNLGALIFVDLRDRSGIIQLVINPGNSNYEIAMFVLLIDAYLTGTYSYERFLTCLNYWTTYSDFYVKKGKMFLETSKGTMPIQRASHILKLPEMAPIERLQKCHILAVCKA